MSTYMNICDYSDFSIFIPFHKINDFIDIDIVLLIILI